MSVKKTAPSSGVMAKPLFVKFVPNSPRRRSRLPVVAENSPRVWLTPSPSTATNGPDRALVAASLDPPAQLKREDHRAP